MQYSTVQYICSFVQENQENQYAGAGTVTIVPAIDDQTPVRAQGSHQLQSHLQQNQVWGIPMGGAMQMAQQASTSAQPVGPAQPNAEIGQGQGYANGEHDDDDDDVRAYLRNFANVIQYYKKISPWTWEINFPVNNLKFSTLKRILEVVFTEVKGKTCVISMQAGYLLRHAYTHVLRYFYPSLNTALGNENFKITAANSHSYKKVLQRLRGVDWEDYLLNKRPSSVWVLQRFTNVRVLCYFFRQSAGEKESG